MTGSALEEAKPRLRGLLHAIMVPAALACGAVLVALARPGRARVGCAVYAFSSLLLFAVSAAYHRGQWSPRVWLTLRRLDHANIFLLIAGTYTPLCLIVLQPPTSTIVLVVVWAGAFAGTVFSLAWPGAPRWLIVPLYAVLGWAAVFVLPQLLGHGGVAVFVLVVVGGLCYTVGALAYAARRPNPVPGWFGFHEVFHSFTVAAYLTQYVAVSLAAYR
ncbi:MAG TPA: hemolysin III family protein [Mycobacteriales bacterium]|nr:hemolysin III family protein [Mycobacteriales bacterium]